MRKCLRASAKTAASDSATPGRKTDPTVAAGAGKSASAFSAGDAVPATTADAASRERNPRRSRSEGECSCERESFGISQILLEVVSLPKVPRVAQTFRVANR